MAAIRSIMIVLLVTIGAARPTTAQVPPHVNFQGRLTDSTGAGLNTAVDLTFTIFEDELGTVPLWTEIHPGVPVGGGLFSVILGEISPFPDTLWTGPVRFVGIRIDGGPISDPLQPVVSVVYSIRSGSAAVADEAGAAAVAAVAESVAEGAVGQAAIAEDAVTSFGIANNSIELIDIGNNGATEGQILKWLGDGWAVADDDIGSGSVSDTNWHLQNYVLYTGGGWGLARAGNVLYGDWDRTHVNLGVACTTGTSGFNDWYVTLGGGYGNLSRGAGTTVAGGFQNSAAGSGATVGGGITNAATRTGATIAGGGSNTANGIDATVGGGNINQASADFSTVGGGINNVASDTSAVVSGGEANVASGIGASVGGGAHNFARGKYSAVAGGGGPFYSDSNSAFGDYSVVAGGQRNVVTPAYGFIGSGRNNVVSGQLGVVAGGDANEARDPETTIGGGANNIAESRFSTISGGSDNITGAPMGWHANAVIGGGSQNSALHQFATVGGGGYNSASALRSTIAGGMNNRASDTAATVGGGGNCYARGMYSVVAGGGGAYGSPDSNAASGAWSVVPGGQNNVASGDYSFAAGRRARASHAGSFVWADTTDSDFSSTQTNEFAVSAQNGARISANSESYGMSLQNSGNGDGIRAYSYCNKGTNWGALYAVSFGSSPAISAFAGTGPAAYMTGDVTVTGTLIKGAGSFKIDHPLDPENKYLYHSFVESPDMMNVYNGNAVLDGIGEAWIELPDWFEALNGDYRYQLTAIGAPSPNLYIAQKISGNRFKIAGGSPGLEVSWQVTGIRRDAYANAHRIQVEQTKPRDERGKYLHPAELGKLSSSGINNNVAKDGEVMRR